MCAKVGILGGTFDPVHTGHLRIALAASEVIGLDQVRMIPCGQPVHRSCPVATAEQRLAMLRLAVADHPHLVVDERELRRDAPSYMIDTINSLQAEAPGDRFGLILGADAWAEFGQWYRWPEILERVDVILFDRPGRLSDLLPQELALWLAQHNAESHDVLFSADRRCAYVMPTPAVDISASGIRSAVAQQRSSPLLPPGVQAYIDAHQLYR